MISKKKRGYAYSLGGGELSSTLLAVAESV
jgi:hypothetical protein